MTDIRQIVFTRGDGAEFTFGLTPPYQLHPDTLLPSAQALDSSGIEYIGRNGGMGLAARVQRQTVDITFNVVARDPNVSYTQLLSDASMFFRPMNSDLSVTRFDMTVTMCDGVQWMMRRGHVSVPFSAPATRLLGIGVQGKLGLIFDDPNRYWVSGAGVVSGDITPSGDPGTMMGEKWQGGLQMFAGGKSQWFMPSAGAAGVPQSVTISSAYPVPVSFKIFGQITNPKLVNITNGDTWSWPGTLKSGEVLTVDEDGVLLDQHGIRRFNASGGLKAEPGVNTFALYGQNVSHLLSTAWTGTANASTSTLLQDGSVVATNVNTDPNCTLFRSRNSDTVTVVKNADNTVTYTAAASPATPPWFVPMPWWGFKAIGNIQFLRWRETDVTLLEFESMFLANGPGWMVVTTKPGSLYAGIKIPNGKSMTLLQTGEYTADDWAAMQARGTDWFSGDSVSSDVPPLVDSYAQVSIRGAF